MHIEMYRLNGLIKATGNGRSKIYSEIEAGLFMPPVKWGRNSVWPSHEVSEVFKARIAGKSDDEIKQIVSKLVADRQLAA